jgi:hypothetical protein
MGIFNSILADHEECGLGIELIQRVKDEWGCLRDRAVIKSQINRLLMTIHPPQGVWEEPTQEYSGLFN